MQGDWELTMVEWMELEDFANPVNHPSQFMHFTWSIQGNGITREISQGEFTTFVHTITYTETGGNITRDTENPYSVNYYHDGYKDYLIYYKQGYESATHTYILERIEG